MEYPTDEELERIKQWPLSDWRGLLDYVGSLWEFPEFGWRLDGDLYSMATGGWSGNEGLIGAMQSNVMFWALCWQSSHRGGLYKFKLPASKDKAA